MLMRNCWRRWKLSLRRAQTKGIAKRVGERAAICVVPPNFSQSRSEYLGRETIRPQNPLAWSIKIAFTRPWTLDHTLGRTPPSTCAFSMRPRIPWRLAADWEVPPNSADDKNPTIPRNPWTYGENDDMSMESHGASCQHDATFRATVPGHMRTCVSHQPACGSVGYFGLQMQIPISKLARHLVG